MICQLLPVPAQEALQVLKAPSHVRELLDSLERAGRVLSLEKSWHGLHFLLSGSAWGGEPPLDFLASGGEPVGDLDVGYGPARLLVPEQVASLNSALAGITEGEFASRFDPGRLAEEEIYPQIWDEPPEDLLGEYWGYFLQAKSLIAGAARDGDAILIVIA